MTQRLNQIQQRLAKLESTATATLISTRSEKGT